MGYLLGFSWDAQYCYRPSRKSLKNYFASLELRTEAGRNNMAKMIQVLGVGLSSTGRVQVVENL